MAIFGFILNNFQEILYKFQSLDDVYEDEDELNKFLDTLKYRYNHGISIDDELKHKIEKLFEYRWLHDRNQGM